MRVCVLPGRRCLITSMRRGKRHGAIHKGVKKMYLFELFDDNLQLPAMATTITKLGLTAPLDVRDGDILTWKTVCDTIVGMPNSIYRDVRPIISAALDAGTAAKYVIDALVNRNFYKYRAMRDIIAAEYDPIANYDMTEKTTVTYTGGQTTNNTQNTDDVVTRHENAATDSITYGEQANTTTVGAATDTTTTPETATTTQRGATTETATTAAAVTTETTQRDVYGYDAPQAGQIDGKDTRTLNAPEQTATTRADAVTDTVTTNEITVTNNSGERNATALTGEHTDTTNTGERETRETRRAGDTVSETTYNNRQDTTELKRTGNIGVTTSQQLLQSELTLRAATEYINTLATDIVNALTLGVYGLGGM